MTTQRITTKYRGITPEVFDFYGVKYECSDEGEPVHMVFPTPDGRVLKRNLKEKEFWWDGKRGSELGLFGSDRFPAGSAKIVTVTEGYLDALSVFQMHGEKFPVVAVQSVGTHKKEIQAAYDYLNSFEKIYLCLDADIPGDSAAEDIGRMFDFNKVYVVRLNRELKDPNEYLRKGAKDDFIRTWWAAKRFLPESILSSYSDFDKIIDEDRTKTSVPYPFEKLQQLTYGIRTGEIILFTAQEGIGKTEIFRALEYNLLKQTDANIGVIHLEEGKARTLKGLAGYELGLPIHLPNHVISKEELKSTIRKVTKRDDRVHIYAHFGSDDPEVLLSSIRFMAGACDCKYIFLDHITMAVTGLQGEDERRALDYISTRLAMMVEELDFCLFLISHVNDQGQTRGSRNIAKICDIRVDLDRDLTTPDEALRNTTWMSIAKNRFSGETGPAGALMFNAETFMLKEVLPQIEEG